MVTLRHRSWAILCTGLAAASCTGSGGHSAGTGGAASSTGSSASGSGGAGGADGGGGRGGGGGRPADPAVNVDLQGHTYDIFVPTGLDAGTAAPLVLELHGYAPSSQSMTPWLDEEAANQLQPEAQKRGIILVLPHGSLDASTGYFFWNATDACCDVSGSGANDIGYLMAVIADVASKHKVDPQRVFAFGHGNGGFMVNRMGCDQADKIAGVVSLAGETYLDPSKCAASAPLAFLEVQGDADMVVAYEGGALQGISNLAMAPGALTTTQDWAAKNRCSPKADLTQPQLSLMTSSAGMPDTTKFVYDSGCEGNGQTELWTIHLGPYAPVFTAAWAPDVFTFLMAHPKP